MQTGMASFNTADMWTTQVTQQPYEEKDEPEEDQYQESIVSGNDGRRKVDVFKPQLDDIYGCIGELDVEFDYNVSHKWRGNLTATGTIIHIKDTKCYILTAAHNIRANVIYCTSCNTYRVPKRNHKKTRCAECNKSTGADQQQKILKATKIIFRDRSIEFNNYGKTLENYECTELYVPDIKYMQYPKPKDGFDWSFLTFIDSNKIYKKRMQHINIDLIEWNSEYKQEREYGIFGYPTDKDNKMVGMKSNNINEFSIKYNEITKQYYLHQTGIDTFEGQSGSLIWCKHNNEIKICAIHVGGSNGTKKNPIPYNIGTLINAQIMQKWEQIIMECEEEIVSRMSTLPRQLQLYPQYDRQPSPPDTPPVDGCYVSADFRRVQYQHEFVKVNNGINTKSGDLKIKIHCGKSLRHVGNFASITINNITLKTKKVLPKRNPKWNEILIFNDYKPDMYNCALISIGHKCPILGEKVIGVAEFTLPIFFNQSEKMEIEIADKKNNLSGMIVLEHCLIYKENNE